LLFANLPILFFRKSRGGFDFLYWLVVTIAVRGIKEPAGVGDNRVPCFASYRNSRQFVNEFDLDIESFVGAPLSLARGKPVSATSGRMSQ
jgi:hypothetical protein